MSKQKTIATILCLSSALICVGCDGGALRSGLDSYLEDLARATSQPSSVTGPQLRLQPYPGRRGIRVETDEVRLGLLEFLGLGRRCGIGSLVGSRNSAMGKVMPDSQRLVYEQELLRALADCRHKLLAANQQTELAELDELLEQKSAEIYLAFWNATVAGPEFEKLFSLSGDGPLSPATISQAGSASTEALDYLLRSFDELRPDGHPLNLTALEGHLRNLSVEGQGGRILASAGLVVPVLETATVQLRSSGRAGDCLVLQSVYSSRVQGWFQDYLRDLDEVAGAFFHRLERLLEIQESKLDYPIPEGGAFSRYRDDFLRFDPAIGLWSRMQRARLEHAAAWQQALSRCADVRPGLS